MLKHNLYNVVMNFWVVMVQRIVSPDGVNFILDIWLFFPIIQEFHDGVKVVFISWFKPLAVM